MRENLVFKTKHQSGDPNCGSFSVDLVPMLRWLGIIICSSISTIRSTAFLNTKNKLKGFYATIVTNLDRHSCKALAILYSNFCGHYILFLLGIGPFLNISNTHDIRTLYFHYFEDISRIVI